MRVLYLNPCGQLGGAETSLLEILRSVHAAESKWELCLVLGEDGPFAAEARKRGAQVIIQPFPPALAHLGDAPGHPLTLAAKLLKALAATLGYRRGLAKTIEDLRPDVIHTNGFKMHALAAWARPRGIPLVWHIHDYLSTRRTMSRLLRLCQTACSAAIVNSRSVAKDVESVLPNLKIVPVYNGVDLESFSESGPKLDLDALSGLPPAPRGTVRVGLIGTFARWKGHAVFLQALQRLPAALNFRGYIIGGPIYQTQGSQWSLEELQQQVERLGLAGRVGFTGFVRDVPGAMRALDIMVHASTEPEPFGMVIIEAMACAKALIASQAGGASELINGDVAVSHQPGDVAGLAEHIHRLAADEAYRERLGRAARELTERQYGSERLAAELVSVYRLVGAIRNEEAAPSLTRAVEAVSK